MNPVDIILIVLIIGAVVGAVIVAVRSRKRGGCCGCDGGSCCHCGRRNEDSKN